MEKVLYDFRGKERRIFRLANFYKEGLIHAVFYHVLVIISLLYGAIILASLFYGYAAIFVFPLTAVVLVLFTPQFFETTKGLSMMLSGGIDFNHFNEETRFIMKTKYKRFEGAGRSLPYLALAVWAAGFIVFVYINVIW